MNGVIKRTVGPSDCALAFAIPLTRKDFLRDLEPTSDKDFVQSFARKKSGILPEVLWESFYKPQVDVALRIADEVSRLGVKISFNLKISELACLLNRTEVVMIVAHWRSAKFKSGDFINLLSLVPGLMYSNNRVAKILREQFSAELKQQLEISISSEISPFQLEPILLEELNRSLTDTQLYQWDFPDGGTVQPDTLEHRMYRNRLALEEAFPKEFVPGNRFELYDGLHSIEAVVEKIPSAYAGILDLTTCNSILLAEGIKPLRRNCIVLANLKPARLDFRLVLFKNVILQLASRNSPYVDVVVGLRKGLVEREGVKVKKLRKILTQYIDRTLVMGEEESKLQLNQLQSDLKALAKKNRRKVLIRVITMAVIFASWAWLVWIWRNDAQRISLVFGASGISISWIFQKITELWEEKTASEITLTLIINMRDDASNSVVEILSKKL